MQYVASDAAHVVGGDALHGREVVAGKIEVAGEQPVGAEVVRLARAWWSRASCWLSESLRAFSSSAAVTPFVANFVEQREDLRARLASRLPGSSIGIDAEKPGLARRVAPRVDANAQGRVPRAAAVKPRAAAAAEHHRERRRARAYPGCVTSGTCQARCSRVSSVGNSRVRFAPAELRGLCRDEDRRQRCGADAARKASASCAWTSLGIHVADDDEEHVVRDVARLVVGHHSSRWSAVEDIEMADDRVPVRMLAIRRGEKRWPAHAVRVVITHRELAPDDLLFLDVFLRRQRRIHAPRRRAVRGRRGTPLAGISIQ